MDDDIKKLQLLAGINLSPLLQPYDPDVPSNEMTGTEKAIMQRENNIKPGTNEWFKLWFKGAR